MPNFEWERVITRFIAAVGVWLLGWSHVTRTEYVNFSVSDLTMVAKSNLWIHLL